MSARMLDLSTQTLSAMSTPPSPSSTVSCLASPQLKGSPSADLTTVFTSNVASASNVIEFISSRSSLTSTVHVYDLAEQAGFGMLAKSWSTSDLHHTAAVLNLQTRPGAGRALVGRLSEETHDGILTAYTTPAGLSVMAHALSHLPVASPTRRLVIQLPRVVTFGDSLSLSPSLAPLANVLPLLPSEVVVLLSATPQESVDLAALSYNLGGSHVIHAFDHHGFSREVGNALIPPLSTNPTSLSVSDAVKSAGYSFFDYAGDAAAHTVIVALNGPLVFNLKALASQVPGLGVVVVRVLRPWDEAALRKVLPPTVLRVHVLDDVPNTITRGPAYTLVLSTLLGLDVAVHGHRITPAQTEEFLSHTSALSHFLLRLLPTVMIPTTPFQYPEAKKLLFFAPRKSPLAHVPGLILDTFSGSKDVSARILTDHDTISKQGGITSDRILISRNEGNPPVPISIALPLVSSSEGQSDFLGVVDHSLLKTHQILNYAKRGSVVLIASPWSTAEFVTSLPPETVHDIVERKLRVYAIDTAGIAAKLGNGEDSRDTLQHLILYHAFLRLYFGSVATEILVQKVALANFGKEFHGMQLTKIGAHAWAGLFEVDFASSVVEALSGPSKLREYYINAISADTIEGGNASSTAHISSWHAAARHLLFPDIYSPILPSSAPDDFTKIPSLHPEIPDHTYLLTCTVNRRLTPLDYDRNVFHIELDTSGTGLKYAIGEALGVHGWNDEQDVLDFCAWYGVDPARLITIPVAAGQGVMHTRTVLQALQQQIDIFGRPPKAFYTDLAQYANNQVDKLALAFIGSPEGAATFKKLAEKDTVSFADVLRLYPSARPNIEILCGLVGDIKPRHYSIASAQSVVGDRVDLLVVSVDWVTPEGRPKYGQCTRYLAGLRPGQKVTASIKPSVMRLPPDDMQPIIMAGLGTGAAPFRAFLQHRAWLSAQSIPVGPTYYYFGSRHQSQEYLYGEEIEAYITDGTIARAGLAFSRDGPKKVYIQHKMLQDADELARLLHDEKGAFYLCGPTWPVPDVYQALVGALVKHKGIDSEDAGMFLEGLKEEERYVLEVY